MNIDSIKGASVAYQGSVSTTNNIKKADVSPKVEPVRKEAPSEPAKKQIVSSDENIKSTKEISSQDTAAIKRVIDQMNTLSDSTAVFGYHEDTHRITIKIVDKETDEVIKEFPPEKMLDMVAKTWELLGLMVDEKR